VLFECPWILWILWRGKYQFTMKQVFSFGFFFLLGLLPYLNTMYVAQNPTKGSWGDTSTLSGLIRHILRTEYGTFKLSPIKEHSEVS
jgi:hypothetical protein